MKKKTRTPLTLHRLITELSFWGSATRFLLFFFVALVVFFSGLSEAGSANEVDSHIMVFIYALGSYILFDFCYVLIARAYSLKRSLDVTAVIVTDLLMALLYILPRMVVSSHITVQIDPVMYVFFIALGAVAMRLLLGLLFGSSSASRPKKRR